MSRHEVHVKFGMRWLAIAVLFSAGLTRVAARAADPPPFIDGADISALPAIEHAGGVYRENGQPADAIQILRSHGCNLFRVRLFVHPNTDFASAGGASQDLTAVLALAKRIKASGAQFLLDFHYSDTWADPAHQITPAAWKSLDRAALEKTVHDYTAQVLAACKSAQVSPDMVQIGNEVTSGILWPTAQLYKATGTAEPQQWEEFARLLNAAAKAVREASTPAHNIRIVLHIHGGGRAVPVWFFDKLKSTPVDFDIIGLSFYPAWDDALPVLQQNLAQLSRQYGKDILIAETSYPWSPLPDVHRAAMTWPQTPQGQAKFLADLIAALHATPDGHGIGFVWWYPEAIPLRTLPMWRDGAEGLFDRQGNVLPAADLFRGPNP